MSSLIPSNRTVRYRGGLYTITAVSRELRRANLSQRTLDRWVDSHADVIGVRWDEIETNNVSSIGVHFDANHSAVSN